MAVIPLPGTSSNWQQIYNTRTRPAELSQMKLQGAQTEQINAETKDFIDSASVRKAKNRAEQMQAEEFTSETNQQMRQIAQVGAALDTTGNILTSTPDLQDPQVWSSTKQALGPMAEKLGMPDSPDPEWYQNTLTGIQHSMDYIRSVGIAKAQVTPDKPKSGQVALDSQGRTYPTFDIGATKYIQEEDGRLNVFNPNTHRLTSTKSDLDPLQQTPARRTATQKELQDGIKTLSQLSRSMQNYSEEFFTNFGKINSFTGDQLARMGEFGKAIDNTQKKFWDFVSSSGGEDLPEPFKIEPGKKLIEYRTAATKAIQDLEQFFHSFRHSITGAQASYIEIKNLRKSIVNADLNPYEIQDGLARVSRELLNNMERTAQLLQDGYGVTVKWVEGKDGELVGIESPPFPLTPAERERVRQGLPAFENMSSGQQTSDQMNQSSKEFSVKKTKTGSEYRVINPGNK